MAPRWRSVAISFFLWAWLSATAQARPFVLLSGWDSLPDDDLAPPGQADASQPFLASVGRANVRADDGGPVYVVSGIAPNVGNPAQPALSAPYAKLFKGTPLHNSWGLPVQSPMAAQAPSRRMTDMEAKDLRNNLDRLTRTVPTLDRFGSGIPGGKFVQPNRVVSDVGEASALSAATIERLTPAEPLRCHDPRQDVVIESGLQGSADVFSRGRAMPAWATASRSPYVLPSAEQVAVFVIRTGQAASLQRPVVAVSDSSLLTVQLAEKQGERSMVPGADAAPVVFVSKHICKKAGAATVTITLPLQKTVSASSCPGLPAPAVFAYTKVCPPISHAGQVFMRALSAKLPDKDKVIALRSKALGMPWHGIVPTGGVRVILGVFLAMAFCVMIYECGSHFLSNKIKATILEIGPVMLGCEASIDHVSLSFWFGHMTYTIQGLSFANPTGVVCQKEFFMKIDEVKIWFNLSKLICTWGNEIEIRQLVARHIQANVEIDGYVFGESNISKVMIQMEKNNKKWIADLAAIKDNHGIDASAHWSSFEAWMKQVAERVTLQEVELEGIGYSAANKALGIEMKIADMAFHDFSAQHDAVGMTAISYFLTHAVLEGMAEDIAGVEFGHGRFEGLVNSLKAWTAPAAPPP